MGNWRLSKALDDGAEEHRVGLNGGLRRSAHLLEGVKGLGEEMAARAAEVDDGVV